MNRKNRKQRKLKIKILTLVVILVFIAIIALGYKLFTVSKIETEGYVSCMVDSKPNQFEKFLGQNLFLINIGNLEQDLKKQFLCLKQVSLSKVFPNKIKINLSERQPKVIFISVANEATDSASMTPQILQKKDAFLVDEDGVFFSKSNWENLPKIYSWSNLVLGQKIDKDLVDRILKVISELNLLGLTTTDSILNSDKTYLMYSNPAVYFNLNDKLDFQIASLQLILKTAKIDSNVEFIDLRFDKPIVKYNNGKR